MSNVMMKKKKEKKKNLSIVCNDKLFNLILSIFKENSSRKFNYKQISKILNIKDYESKVKIIDVLKKMTNSSILKEIKRGSYLLIEKEKEKIIIIKNTSKKGAYAEINEEEIFIKKEFSHFVLTGDEVKIKINNKRGKKIYKVIDVIKRKKNEFVGIIDSSSSNFFLISDDRKVYFDVFINSKKIDKKQLNKKVLVKVNSWDNNYKNPVGNIIKVIGKINDHDSDINSILYDYGFNINFNKKIKKELTLLEKKITKKEITVRKDIRSTTTFTIDPVDAKDFDDALSVKKLTNKNWEVGVHIADVSHYVKKGSAIDKEALSRACSVYMVDRVVPMLPEILSNNICSLSPNEDKLTFSVFFELDNKANILNYKIKKTIINSDFRFTYDSAQNIINNKKGKFYKELLLLHNFSKILKKRREKEGSINFESSEVKFILDDNKNPIDTFIKNNLSSNKLIEEFMLLANKTVAKHIHCNFKNKNFSIYRIHDFPEEEKINSLFYITKKLGYEINTINSNTLSNSLNYLLKKIKDKPEQKLIETLILRTMQKAKYSTQNIGHFGLGFNFYTHFTSPIRRYPDLIVHRILTEKKEKQNLKELEILSSHCSEKEKNASQAEREAIKYMQIKFIKNKIGREYSGVISGIKEWGIYIEIDKNKCEGLVKINTMNDDHYIYNEKEFNLIGFNTKKKYTIGQSVRIKVKDCNLHKKQINFILVNK